MGVGRFVLTPLLPWMQEQQGLTLAEGSALATANYVGYLVGALLAARVRTSPFALAVAGLLVVAVTTIAMAWPLATPLRVSARLVAGIASAWTFVGIGTCCLAHVRGTLAGVVYGGVGLGIAAVGLATAAYAELGVDRLWLGSGVASIAAATICLVALPRAARSQLLPRDRSRDRGRALRIAYGLFGFGYAVPMTYLPAIARAMLDDPATIAGAWPLLGVTAAVATIVVACVDAGAPLRRWIRAQTMLTAAVGLAAAWPRAPAIVGAALVVGATFMVITMAGIQEIRRRSDGEATASIGRMTASFAIGQTLAPAVGAGLAASALDDTAVFRIALAIAAVALAIGTWVLVRERESNADHREAPR